MTSRRDGAPKRWRFLTPLEHEPATLEALIQRAWPESTASQRAALLEAAQVTIDGVATKRGDRRPRADQEIAFEARGGEEIAGLPEAEELARGEGWVVVEKPVGMRGALVREDPMNSVLFLADMLGMDRATFEPAMKLPTSAGGPWLCGATAEDAERLREAWRSGQMMCTFRALAPRVERPSGALTGPGGLRLTYAVTRYEQGLCELQVIPNYEKRTPQSDVFEPFRLIRATLAQAGIALLGDRAQGGYMVTGGLRLRVESMMHSPSGLEHSWEMPRGWWPEAPVIAYDVAEAPPEDEPSERAERARSARGDEELEEASSSPPRGFALSEQFPTLKVSDKTLEVMRHQGHPWVLSDAQTGGRDHFKPGTLVRLVGKRSKQPGAWALIEGSGELAARRWAEGDDIEAVERFEDEVLARVDEAIVRRAELLEGSASTTLFRLIHGEADGLPGLCVDRVGGLLRATLTGQACRGFRKLVYDNLLEHDPHTTLIEVWHTEDVRQRGDLPSARLLHGAAGARRVIGLEDDLKYWCEPWEGIDVGLFADQRDNRRRLRRLARPGQRWLNLFGHTGAFSVALASQGAEVVNVDLSARYIEWTRENFELNGLDRALDVGVVEDARTYLERLSAQERFDGVIVDPPTAAAGSAGFWSVRRDYGELLSQGLVHLKPGGVMLACRNDKRARAGLDVLLRESAERVNVPIEELIAAPPSCDFPRLEGFPEGDRFEGWIVKRA